MQIQFWGVRGSTPSPLSSRQIQNRIAAVVQRIKSKDIESQESREKFISSLPEWIFGTIGGNTSCVELENSTQDTIIFDAGSGLRELSLDLNQRMQSTAKGKEFHLFFSHFHWDHIQGLPFFSQAFDPNNTLYFYSTNDNLKSILSNQMTEPYFPIPMMGIGGFNANMHFIHLDKTISEIKINNSIVTWIDVDHPGGCTAYKVRENNKSFVYATDTELTPETIAIKKDYKSFFSKVDLLVLDSQYTLMEGMDKTGWGHTPFSTSVDFAQAWNVKNLAFFHHEPTYSDHKIYSLKQSAQWYQEYSGIQTVNIIIAREGLKITI